MTGVGDYAGKISADYYITHDTSGTPDGYLPAPKFNPVGCSFTDKITVTITGAEGADIFYTLDGTLPTTKSKKYEGPIEITETTTLSAVSISKEMGGVVNMAEYIKTGTGGDDSSSSGSSSSGSSSSGSSSGGSSSGIPGNTTTTEPPVDTEITTETTEDGTKIETKVETNPDGTKVETKTETNPDGTSTVTVNGRQRSSGDN